jgi:type I restriction-modification system DNA methylase subunit
MFQQSIFKTFSQNEELVAKRFVKYQEYKNKIEFLKIVKEEKYQDGFLKDIFENSLGYTLDSSNPKSFNLEREKKNETDGKKADGVIILNSEVVGVIELKDQKTKNLDQIESQAFNYHNSHTNSKYIIISNFDELRFYIDKKTAYEKFNLFSLTYDEFKKLHLLLSFESIKEQIPLKLKEKSSNYEAEISKQLYKDFSAFRTHLFENIVKNNDQIDKSTLLRLTQKLCDRIIFILFAEDRELLKHNTIKEIRDRYHNDIVGLKIYDYYKIYFNAINNGNDKLSIPKYNGGLFAKDELLDSLKIDDIFLDKEAQKLSDYDFASDISVNILGHIFEQSLTDLEEIQSNIDDIAFDKTKSKRKKDGVFYTPEYITKYIVQNTLGKLCDDKKIELNLQNVQNPANPKKLTAQEKQTLQNIYTYRGYLLNLKILDPACGSGAFLNQALEFLIKEHNDLDELRRAYENELLSLYDIEINILEHNLYGVDINEDAVEIAKLSLWLRTAQRGKSLTNLSEKIVCANSLLNMPFSENSFDIVIGNPPYVRVQGLKSNYEDESKLYEAKYCSATGKYDLYALFLEMSFKMLNSNGKLSYILPHKFLISDFGSGLRGFLAENKAVESLLHFGSEMVFEDASTYTCIITLSHNNEKLNFKSISPKNIFDEIIFDDINYEKLGSDKWSLSNQDTAKVLEKINLQPLKVKDVFAKIFTGIQTSGDDIFMLRGSIVNDSFKGYSKKLNQEVILESHLMKPILKGQDIKRNRPLETNLYIIYPHFINTNNETKVLEEMDFSNKFPLAYEYLLNFKDELITKKIKYKTNPKYWYSLHRAREIKIFENEKIVTPQLQNFPNFTYDIAKSYSDAGGYNLVKKDTCRANYKFLLTILNSSVMWFFIKNTSAEFGGGYYYFKTAYLEPFPLPKLENLEQQEPFIQKADLMLELNKKLQTTKQNFHNELGLDKLSNKLQKFEELQFDEFVKEFTKAKKIKFADKLAERNFKNDWKALFENDKKEVLQIQNQINITDKEIDQMVYKLYDLSDDEIKIVEGN